MSDEQPPQIRRGRTPAERAGATPLDPDKFRIEAMPTVRRRRGAAAEADPGVDVTADAPSELEQAVVRRRRRRRRSTRPWFVAAAVLAVAAVVLGCVGWFGEPDVAVAAGTSPDLVATTPVLSARRAPELVSRPVAARNLREAVAPVLADAPPQTCLEVRDGTEALVSHRGDEPLRPASNMKLVVGAAALELIGPDERLVTRFATDGAPTDGTVVRGNLYMIGGGDPLLTTDSYEPLFTYGVPPLTDMESVADRVAATGITRVTGSVVGDGSRYDAERVVQSWPRRFLTQGQVGPLSALVVNDGWTVDPLRSGVGGGPAEDPDRHAAQVMTALLEARGVDVAGAATAGVAPEGAATLVDVPSLTVAELVGQLLAFSDNTTTEMLVKEIGVRAGAGGSTAAGLDAIRSWLDAEGHDATGVGFDDGSGLSDNDRVTCSLLSSLLVSEGAGGVVAEGLARPGRPGTLNERMETGPLRDAVRAKTGTLRSVTALSGWLHTTPGVDLAFSFVVNVTDRNIVTRDVELQERLLRVMMDHPVSPPLEFLGPAAPVPGP